MAVTVGFEPTVRGYRTQHFECCTFGRSDTSPDLITLQRTKAETKTRGPSTLVSGQNHILGAFLHPLGPEEVRE